MILTHLTQNISALFILVICHLVTIDSFGETIKSLIKHKVKIILKNQKILVFPSMRVACCTCYMCMFLYAEASEMTV